MRKDPPGPVRSRRYLRIRASMLSILSAPFFSPKKSHACQAGMIEVCPRKPNPQIAWWGFLSLNRNGAPGGIARKARAPEGCQKLTSSGGSMRARCRYRW